MPDLDQLLDQRKALIEDAENIAKAAEEWRAEPPKDESDEAKEKRLAEPCEGRNLTDEEQADYDGKCKTIEDLSRRIERQERTNGWHQSGTGRRIVGAAAVATENRMTVPAVARRHGRLRGFVDVPGQVYEHVAEERAYRMGQFIRASLGLGNANTWCRDNGVFLEKSIDVPGEARLHQENVNTTGGYWVPEEFDGDMIRLIETFGVFRQRARSSVMASDTKTRTRRTGGLTANFIGEGSAITESTAAIDQVSLVAKKLGIATRITNELNEDAIISVADFLITEIAQSFATKEDDCGFNGDGTSAFGGITGVRESLRGLSSTRADIAGIVIPVGNEWTDLSRAHFQSVAGLLPKYAETPNTAWYCSKVFWHEVIQELIFAAGGATTQAFEDGAAGNWLGWPVITAQQMPSVDADDQLSVFLGDLTLAADFGVRRATTIKFSEHATINSVSVFETDEIGVVATERFDINVHDVGNATSVAADKVAGPIVGILMAAS